MWRTLHPELLAQDLVGDPAQSCCVPCWLRQTGAGQGGFVTSTPTLLTSGQLGWVAALRVAPCGWQVLVKGVARPQVPSTATAFRQRRRARLHKHHTKQHA